MADLKITQLTENTIPLTTDLLPMVDDPAGSPLTQKLQFANLSHTIIKDIGTNTHAQIDTHIADASDPHGAAMSISTSLTDPLIIGGTATTADLTLQTTSGVGTTGADMHFLVGNNGATEAMTILNSGNVGIGTTGPSAKLEVNGQIYSDVTGANQLMLNTASAGYGMVSNPSAGVWSLGYASAIGTLGTSVLSWNTGGNVGIGTTAPGYKLDVQGAVPQIVSRGSVTTVGGMVSAINSDGAQFATLYGGQASDAVSAIWWNSGQTGLKLGTATSLVGAGESIKMTILSTGNVGIGTTNPTNGVLEVVGQVYGSANCSMLSYTDRTPFYEGDAIKEISKISSKDGEIDHTTLPDFVRVERTIIVEPATDEKEAVTKIQQERNLGAMVSMLTVAVQQLNDKLTKLQALGLLT